MPYPAQLQGPALPKSVSCYVLLLFRVAIAQVFNICSTLKIKGDVQLSYYHAALVLSIKKVRSSAVCFVIFVVEPMLCRGSITARRHVLCIGSVSLRRPEGWLFHRSFFCLVHMIPCSVGSCLDHSGALAHLAARFVCGVGDAAPLLWGKVYHTFLLYGRAAFSGGRVTPPYHTKNCTAFGLCSFIKIIVLSAGAYSVPELSCVSPPVSPVSASGSLWASV